MLPSLYLLANLQASRGHRVISVRMKRDLDHQSRRCLRVTMRLQHQGFTTFGNEFIDLIEILIRESLMEMDHHPWVKWCLS